MRFFDKNENEMMHLVDLKVPAAKFELEDTFMCGWPEDITKLCVKIWNVIEHHNFDIPGLKPHFVMKDDMETVQMMSIRYNGWFRIWGSGEIATKTMKVHCWGNWPSSAHLEYFVGEIGTDDHEDFLNGRNLVNSKLRDHKKIHLRYESKGESPFRHDNDLGRLYDPTGNEPSIFTYAEVMDHVRTTCQEVLTELEALPRPDQKNIFTKPNDIPLTNPLFEGQPLYGYAKLGEKEALKSLESGYRMVPLGGTKPKDHKYRNLMNEGFVALEREFHDRPADTDYYQSGMYTSSQYEFLNVYEIHLKNANHVYVVDSSLREKAKAKAMEEHEKKHPNWQESTDYDIRSPRFTDQEVDQIRADQAATMVHINDYRGEYDKPIVMVCRRVDADEVGALLSSKNYYDFHPKKK